MIGRIAALFCLLVAFTAHAEKLRYMVAVDTGHSMLARKPAVVKLVRELVGGGFDGQITPGDQFTIWVYNEANYWNRFPIQIWNPEKPQLIGEIGAQFIASEIFEKQTRFDPVARDIGRLILAHPDMVLLLVTDGESPITGIDFDVEVNIEIGNLKKQIKPDRRLFVVSLLSLNGKLQSWRVFPAEAEITLPRLPPRKDQLLEVAKVKPAALSGEELRKRSLAALADRPAKLQTKKEPARPPVVYDLPPGAKVLTPPPVETIAEASTTPIIDSPTELELEPAPKSDSSIKNSAVARSQSKASPVPASTPVAPVKTQAGPALAESKKAPEPAANTQPVSGKVAPLVAAQNLSKAPQPTNNFFHTATNGLVAKTAVGSTRPPRHPGSTAEAARVVSSPIEDSGSSLLWIYCLAAVGALIALGIGIFLLQRRAHLRGSIISESYSIR